MKKHLLRVALLCSALVLVGQAAYAADTKITLWTQEGESDAAFKFIQDSIAEFQKANPGVTIDLVQKGTEALREDFQNASIAGQAPELLWTVSDHAGPFTLANLIQPVDKLFNMKNFVPGAVAGVTLKKQAWGVPISAGNHLMLIYNKNLVKTAPATTDALIKAAQDVMKKKPGTMGLVYNQVEAFWMVPWLAAFKGSVFGPDGTTPTLNTDAVASTLQFLKDLKDKYQISPAEQDYGTADGFFKEGKAAFIINGDWSLGDYTKLDWAGKDGVNLGIAPLPTVSATKADPAPYISGKFFMIAAGVSGDKLAAVKGFITYVTSLKKQVQQVKDLNRLPGLLAASKDKAITGNPILSGSNAQMVKGVPMPVVPEMRAIWDALKPEIAAVIAGSKTPDAAAASAQKAAILAIGKMYSDEAAATTGK